MKTINEIKQEYEKIDNKLSQIYQCDLIKIIGQKREEIRLMLDEIYNKDEYITYRCLTTPIDVKNIDWKFALDNKNIDVYCKSDYDKYEILVCCFYPECGSFYFAALKENQEFKKLIESYNNFIDEIRGKK